MYDVSDHFPSIGLKGIVWAQSVIDEVTRSIPELKWEKQGSMLCTGEGRSRVGFAARKCWASFHFRDRNALQVYKELGGQCPVTGVTIKIEIDADYDAQLIASLIAQVVSK